MENREIIIKFVMPIYAIIFIIFGCVMSKYFDGFYLGLESIICGVIWFNWAIYENSKKIN